jgi:NAD(P)-dependent dehydrogenase (short-subunit alcohol dehydrogenase family)
MTGARVVIACRDLKKADEAAAEIRRDTKDTEGAGHLVVVKLDLASLASVRQCAQNLLQSEQSIHILVNNAGKRASMHILVNNAGKGASMNILVNNAGKGDKDAHAG